MIPSAGINDPKDYAPGWLGEYCKTMGENKFPWSYHLLAGMFALSSVVGRRGRVQRGPVVLWPPQSILLLGPSAIGKSQSLYMAGRVIEAATNQPWQNADGEMEQYRAGWSYGEQSFTPRGLTEEWFRTQQRQGVDFLEGAFIETEMAKVVTKRQGSETVNTWIITCLEHRDLRDLTGMYGRRVIRNVTAAFAFASTLQYLRKAMDADEFAGGLMHRFLIAHEREGRQVQSAPPDEARVADLVRQLQEIHAACPEALELAPQSRAFVDRLDRQAKYFRCHQLAGFWGRFADLVLRTAQIYTIAQGGTGVRKEDLERAETLLRYRLAPVLEGLVEELDAPPKMKRLRDLADSLETTGPPGMPASVLMRLTGETDTQDQRRVMGTMIEMGLAYKHGKRLYARLEWVPKTDAEPDEPD